MSLGSFVKRIWHSLRRTHVRTPTALTVDWRIPGSRTHHVSPISDVSPGGAFLFTDEPKSVDTPLVLEVATPTGWVQMHARVAWASAHGMGVRFCGPNATSPQEAQRGAGSGSRYMGRDYFPFRSDDEPR